MNLDLDIFKNDKERGDCVNAMQNLLASPAWPFILRVLKLNAEIVDADLRTREDFKNLEEVYGLQKDLAFIENFRDLPKTLMKEARNTKEEEPEEDY